MLPSCISTMCVNCLILLSLNVITVHYVQGFTVGSESRLRENLSTGYNMHVRPANQTKIQVNFLLTAITSVDMRQQEFSVAGWWSMIWNDTRLSWAPKSYDNIPILQMYSNSLWTPATVVDNSVNDLDSITSGTIPLRVVSSGLVVWNPPGLLTVSCLMDVTYFPFDTQICKLQVTSFGYTIQELDLTLLEGSNVNLQYFVGDGEWILKRTWTDRDTYVEGKNEYVRVYFFFEISRRPLYYGLNMLLPVIVTSVLTILVFMVPAESGEKIGYCLTVMLSFIVILTLTSESLPTTSSNASLAGLYVAIVLIMSCFSVLLSIFVLELYHQPDDKPISRFVRKLTVLGMRINCYERACKKQQVHQADDITFVEVLSTGIISENSYQYRPRKPSRNGQSSLMKQNTVHDMLARDDYKNKQRQSRKGYSRRMSELSLRPVTAYSSPEDRLRGGEITWKTVSIVLDGVLFRVYLLALIVISAVLLTLLVCG